MDAVLAFVAGLAALRLSGGIAARYRMRRAEGRAVHLAAWAAGLACYAVAAWALAWGAAAGWDDRAFRVYYLFGGLLTAPLLGIGSLAFAGRRAAAPLGLLYVGVAVGVAVAAPLDPPVHGAAIPAAQDHLAFVPVRLIALLANIAGTLAVVAVALHSLRRRPASSALILAGVAVAASGSAAGGLGEGGLALSIAAGALLLYGGFVLAAGPPPAARAGLRPPGPFRGAGLRGATRSASRGRVG